MPISCHFRDCKALLITSLTHVSGAIASVQTFTFTFTVHMIADSKTASDATICYGAFVKRSTVPLRVSFLYRLIATVRIVCSTQTPGRCSTFQTVADVVAYVVRSSAPSRRLK